MRRILALFLLLTHVLLADSYLSMRGYIGQDDMPTLNEKIDEIESQEEHGIVIHVSSSSGDLQDVFDVARKLHEIKLKKNLKIAVFIEERAVGPAAIIPFLADDLYVTPICVWGDIPYGVDDFVGRDLMRRAIKEIVTPKRPLYENLVDAMIDPHYKISGIQEESFQPIVLNVPAMEKLKLVSSVTTRLQFLKLYPGLEEGQFSVVSSAALQDLFEKHINIYPTGPNYFGYLDLSGKEEIDISTYLYAKFAFKYYSKMNVQAILLHLDSPGGAVIACLKIAALIEKMDVENEMPIICFIDNWALSGNAMFPLASRFVGVTNRSLMGAITKEITRETGIKPFRSTVADALLPEYKHLASFFGRSELLAEAMVNKDILLVLRNDKVLPLSEVSEILPSDQILTKKGVPLTMNAEQLLHSSIAQFLVEPIVLPEKTQEELTDGKWPASKELVFQQPFLKSIPNATVISYKGYKLSFYNMLCKPYVGGLLVMGLLLGLYWQLTTRRFSLASIVALICLTLILFASFAIHLVGWIELIILITGILFVAVELFVLPGYRVTGVFGAILMVLGVVVMLLPGVEYLDFTSVASFSFWRLPVVHLAYLLTAVFLSLLVIYFLNRYQGRTLISSSLQDETEVLQEVVQVNEGAKGKTFTKLDPRGQVLIGSHLYDAISEGDPIERGEAIVVIKVHAHTLVVSAIK